MTINFAEVRKAIIEYKRKKTEAKRKGFKVIGFFKWVERQYYGKA
jgi:hypothetical protein